MLSGFTNNNAQLLLRGTKSVFELCAGIMMLRSGTNNDLYGGSYDQMAYHISFSGLV